MKTLLLVAALALPFAAEGAGFQRSAAIHTGTELAATLGQISNMSARMSRRAAATGNHVRARKLRQISHQANGLNQRVRLRIIRPLRRGVNVHFVHRAFHGLDREFRMLDQGVQSVLVKNPAFIQRTRQARGLHLRLDQLLTGHGPAPAP